MLKFRSEDIVSKRLTSFPRVEYTTEHCISDNVFVGPHRAIFNQDWTLNTKASHHFIYWDSNFRSRDHAEAGLTFSKRCEQLIKKAKSQRFLRLPSGRRYVLCTHYHEGYPFGHWFETLASLRFVPGDDFFVLHKRASSGPIGTRDIQTHLDLLGIPSNRRICVDLHVTIFCPTLETVGIEALIGSISKDAITWLRSKYLSHNFIKNCIDEKPIKLYLSRNFLFHPKKENARTVLNEEKEVWPYLESLGYIMLKGNEPIRDLISLFHNASEIVFPHGALAYFLIFCNRNPKIIEFCSKNRYRECFLNSAMNSEITHRSNYKLILSESDLHDNILIEMAILKSNVS
jgi:hypothetical protein